MPALSGVEGFERIVVVKKKTILEELLSRHHSKSQVRFFLDRRGASIEEYEAADAAYSAALSIVVGALPREISHTTIERTDVPTFLFRATDFVIPVGPDGLVVNVAKYLADEQPILGVNPDTARIDGMLMRVRPEETALMLRNALRGEIKIDTLTLAQVVTNDGQTLYATNDFLAGRRDQISARYTIEHNGRSERQSSSGILISTGVGSSGWMRSLVTGLGAATAQARGLDVPFPWDDPRLLFAVREPFPSKYTKTELIAGEVIEGDELIVTSEMSEGGVIFSDGVPEDAIEFNAGSIARIKVADRSARLVRSQKV